MKRLSPFLLLLALTFSINVFAYDHPGGMHSRAQIEFVKMMIKQKKEPWLSAYRQLITKADSVIKLDHHALADFNVPGYYVEPKVHRANSLSLQADGFAAYCLALAWKLSEKPEYADKAAYFLNAWAKTNKKYSNHDGALVLSYSGTSMLMAGELLRTSKKWSKADRDVFADWAKNVYRKATNEIRGRKNNWADWGRYGSMLADYFLDDEKDMQENIRLIKSDLFEKIAADGHMTEEVKREKNGVWYTYFSLAPITASFWVAYNSTGENLFNFTQDGKTVKKALDYLLYYQQHPAEWKWFKDPNIATPNTVTGFWPVNLFDAMYGIYNDASYKTLFQPHQPIIYQSHHFAWTFPTLMTVKIGKY